MEVSREDALAGLAAIEHARRRSYQALVYERSSAYLKLWGVIWIVGYAGSDLVLRLRFDPMAVNYLWLALCAAGGVFTLLLKRRQCQSRDSALANAGDRAWSAFGGGALVLVLFVVGMRVTIGPRFEQIAGAFFPLLVALFYGLIGLKWGRRYFVASIAVTVLTVGGYLYFPQFFLLWMAVVGGGSLIVVGLWMAQV